MTKRRLILALALTLSVAAAVGGLVYSRTRGPAPDDTGANGDGTPPPAPVTKATTPTRKLNEKERMLVGTWRLENFEPKRYTPGYQAMLRFAPDGTFTYSVRDDDMRNWSRSGTFRIAIDTLITELDGGNTAAVKGAASLIEELTEGRFVISAQNGLTRDVKQWTRVLM